MDIKKMDLKSLADFITNGAEGKTPYLKDEEAAKFEKTAIKIFSETSNDMIIAKLAKISNMNILNMNAHFFDNLPNTWQVIQNATEITVKDDCAEKVEG